MTTMHNYALPLPKYGDVVDWHQVFSNEGVNSYDRSEDDKMEIWIEVGFGLGDNLLYLAQHCPQRCFLGSEVHAAGTGTILQRMKESIETNTYWDGYTRWKSQSDEDTPSLPTSYSKQHQPKPYNNIRIFKNDITKLLPFLPSKSVDAILVTFPDPFFPNGVEWRLLQADVLVDFHRILRGQLFLATDHEQYFSWVQKQMDLANSIEEGKPLYALVSDCPPSRSSWLPVVSKYEEKAIKEGRTKTFMACWETL